MNTTVKGWCHNCKGWFNHDFKRVVVFLLFSIVEKSGLGSVNIICTPFWEIELYDMGPEPGVCNIELICIFEIVTKKDLKIIYEEGSKISKYVASLCVYTSALYHYSTYLCFISST
jgi:hypothetical protein